MNPGAGTRLTIRQLIYKLKPTSHLQILESRQSHWVSFNVEEAIEALQELGMETAKFEIASTPVNPIDVAHSSRGIRFTKSRGKQVSKVSDIVML